MSNEPPYKAGDSPFAKGVAGFITGLLLSAVVWLFFWNALSAQAMFIVIAAKFLIGFVAVLAPSLRHFGGGWLLSMALGALIFFVCASNFAV